MTMTSEFMRDTMAMGTAAMLFGLGATGSAHANVIVVSLDNITSYQAVGNAQVFGAPGMPITSTSSDAASYNAATSAHSATCPGVGPCNAGGLSANALQSTAGPGPFPAEDTFTKPPAGGFVGSRGDANVISSDPSAGPNAAASNVAESRLNSPSTGGAQGSNEIITDITIMGGPNTPMNISFVADPYMQVTVGEVGDSAVALLTAVITLVDANSGIVFQWTPGNSSGEIGVASETDPFSVNQTLIAVKPADNQIFSPIVNPSTDIFRATTVPLSPGSYTLSFQMTETVRAACGSNPLGGPPTGPCSAGGVPEPATLALLGVGLAGLGFSRRRKSN